MSKITRIQNRADIRLAGMVLCLTLACLLITLGAPAIAHATEHLGTLEDTVHTLSNYSIGKTVDFGTYNSVAFRWKVAAISYQDPLYQNHDIVTLMAADTLPQPRRFHLSFINPPSPLFKGAELVTWLNDESTGFAGTALSGAQRTTLVTYGSAAEPMMYQTDSYTIDSSVKVALPSSTELTAWDLGATDNDTVSGNAFWLRDRGYIGTFCGVVVPVSEGGMYLTTGVRNNSTSFDDYSLYPRPVIKVDMDADYFGAEAEDEPTSIPASSTGTIAIIFLFMAFLVIRKIHREKS